MGERRGQREAGFTPENIHRESGELHEFHGGTLTDHNASVGRWNPKRDPSADESASG